MIAAASSRRKAPAKRKAKRKRKEKRGYDPWKYRSISSPLTNAGTAVTPETALSHTAVWSGIRLIAETMGVLPLHPFQRQGQASRSASDHDLYHRLLYEPNPEMTSQAYVETMMTHAIAHGGGFSEIEFSTQGRPIAYWPLSPNVMLKRLEDGTLFYRVPKGTGFVDLPRWAVLHFPGLSGDGVRGYPVIQLLREAVGLGLAQQDYAARFFGGGAIPSAVLEHPKELSKDAAERLRSDWSEKYQGLANSHRLAVLEEGMKYNRISVTPDEAQFLESRKWHVSEIARILRIPPHMLYDLERATFSNIEEQGIDFVTYTLTSWVRRFELEIRRKLFNSFEREQGYYVKFNLAALLRGSTDKRYAAYAVALNNGWLNVDEVRAFEDMPPLPNGAGQTYRFPSTMKTAGQESVPNAA
jgi:HK97 family phage portal protein